MELRGYQTQIIKNVVQAWREGYKAPCIVAPCGSGKSIVLADMAKRTTDNNKHVLFLIHRQELQEQITDTFTNYGVNMNLCTVGMVQTISRRLMKTPEPHLIITDEDHHCLAGTYRKIYDFFPKAYLVGATATPVRLNGSGLGDVNDKLILGPTVNELIQMSCLSDFDYYAPSVIDLKGIKTVAGDYKKSDVEKAMSEARIYGDVIHYYQKLSAGKQAICYCATISLSKTTADSFRNNGISAEHIDGDTPTLERKRIIDDFRNGKLMVLCNVDLISEGFDVPDCTTSILLRPTKSLVLYTQQAMRCMRYKPGKKAVIIDHVGNVHRFGLPNKEREWSLGSKKTNVKKQESDIKLGITQCSHCYATFESKYVKNGCPYCGAVLKKERDIKAEKEARLIKIVSNYESPEECGSMSELIAFAKRKNYKMGWAYYQAKERGLLKSKSS